MDDIKIKVIDSDKLINVINEGSYNINLSTVMAFGAVMLDTKEIIRCKDCKHIRKWRSEESAKKFGQIYECTRGVFACPNPEDFCSHAERIKDV